MKQESQVDRQIRVYLIRSAYQHWSNFSGAHQFIKNINGERFDIYVRAVPIGDSQFPINNQALRGALRYIARARGVRWYGLNDLFAESAVFFDWLDQVPDILHYLEGDHAVQYLPTIMRKLQRYRRRPQIVATFHQPPHLLRWLIGKKIFRSVDHAIVLSPEQVEFMKNYLSEDQISLIPHGVDVNFWQPGNKKLSQFRCLTVGNWFRDYATLNEVARKLLVQPDIELQVVSHKYDNDLELNNISVTTGISDEQLRRLYQQSHLLFLPLKNATANNSILEAIACGLPVVTTDLPGIRYYLPGKEAICIPDNNPELFVEAILKLYSNPDIRLEMATLGRQRAMELSWERVAGTHEQLYASMVSNSHNVK